MIRTILAAVLSVVCLLAVPEAGAQEKPDVFRTATKQWVGVCKDVKQRGTAKEFELITNPAAFEKAWKTWRPKEDLPKVDFASKFAVVVVIDHEPDVMALCQGPKWSYITSLKSVDKVRDGFGWGIAVFDRKGVEELNGKKLPEPTSGK